MVFKYDMDKKGAVSTENFINGLLKNTFQLAKTTANVKLPTIKAYPMDCVPTNPKKMKI